MLTFPERTIYDPVGQVAYEPFVSDDGRVGYRVIRTDSRTDAEAFVYLNPSQSSEHNRPDVFVYSGIENDPAEDFPEVFIDIAAVFEDAGAPLA